MLYAFHNWDLFAVCATVAACWVLLRAGRAVANGPGRAGGAAADRRRGRCCGVGSAAFKLYPVMFALPVALLAGRRRLAGPAAAARCTARSRWLVGGAFAGRHRRGVRC